MTFVQCPAWHVDLRQEGAPRVSLFVCTDQKPRSREGKVLAQSHTVGLWQRLGWRSLGSKLHSLSSSCMESCNFSKLADFVSKSYNS